MVPDGDEQPGRDQGIAGEVEQIARGRVAVGELVDHPDDVADPPAGEAECDEEPGVRSGRAVPADPGDDGEDRGELDAGVDDQVAQGVMA
jgi:hypothetical protein